MLIWISSLQDWKDPQLHEWYIAGIIQWNSWEQCLINLIRGLSRVNDGLHNPLIRPAISLEGGPLSTTARHDNKNCPPPNKIWSAINGSQSHKEVKIQTWKNTFKKNIPNTYHIYIYTCVCIHVETYGTNYYELLFEISWNNILHHLGDLFQIICQLHEKNTKLNFCCTWVISARCSTWRSSWGTKTKLLSTYRLNHWFPFLTP